MVETRTEVAWVPLQCWYYGTEHRKFNYPFILQHENTMYKLQNVKSYVSYCNFLKLDIGKYADCPENHKNFC